MSRPPTSVIAAPQASPADRWVSWAAVATVGALAGLAGAISYSHMRLLAAEHGQAGWHAHAFPLSVDGLELVASLVLLANHRSRRRPGWLPWMALVIGTAGSLTANIATAGPGTVSRIIAGWSALALVISVKLLSGMLTPTSASSPRPAADQDGQDDMSDPAVSRRASARYSPARSPGSRRADAATAGSVIPGPRHGPARQKTSLSAGTRVQPVPGLPPGSAEMLPAARAARDALLRDGHRLTRDALAARLREAGHPIRNSRLTPLLQALRSETTSTPDSGEHRHLTRLRSSGSRVSASELKGDVRSPKTPPSPTPAAS
jgi:hypothetical protein